MRDVKITAVLNGWIVKVGCQTLVYNDKKILLHDLGAYMADPKGTEQAFIKNAVNKRLIADAPPGEPRPAPDGPPSPPVQNLRGPASEMGPPLLVPSYPRAGCTIAADQRASRSIR